MSTSSSMKCHLIYFAIACTLAVANALAAEESLLVHGTHVTVWTPDKGGDKQPLIVFSHGLHGCSTQASFLMRALAVAGYLVVAPDHRDAGCRGGEDREPPVSLGEPARWNDEVYRDRAEDIRRVIEFVVAEDRFGMHVDAERIGLIGHSLGGYTVLGLGGAWPAWRMPGIKAVLALSPYSAPFVVQRTLSGLTAPVMYQGGTRDSRLTPAVRKWGGAYDQSPQPKYYVELEGAGHFAWTDVGRIDRDAIVRYTVAFMNRYVKGEAADASLTRALPGVASFQYTDESGKSATGPARAAPGEGSLHQE
jgi:predicted dienelactone hydrolase